MKKNVLAKKILCGLLAAGVVGVAGSAMAATTYGIKAGTGDEINGNLICTHGKIDGVTYGLFAEGSFKKATPQETSKISLTTENIDINATLVGVSGKQLASLIIGDEKTNSVTIKGVTKGIHLDKGSSLILKGNSVNIISTGTGSNNAAVYVDNKFNSPKMTELVQANIYGNKINIEAAKVGIQAQGQLGDV